MARRVNNRGNDWYADFRYTDPDTGKRKRLIRKSPIQTKRGAERFEHDLKESILTGEFFEERHAAPSLGEHAQDWMDLVVRKDKSENTAKVYLSYLNNHIIPFFGPDTPVDQITPKEISRWKAKKSADGYSQNTLRSMAICLSSLLTQAVEWGDLDEAPDVSDFKEGQQKRPEWMTQDECRQLVNSIEDSQHRAMIVVCWQTGIRKMEMAGLRWGDINWERRTLHLQRQLSRDSYRELPLKSHQDRVIPLTEKALGAFQSVTDNADKSPYVFYDHAHDRAWDANQLRDLIGDIWPESLGKGPGWHILRHSFASQLVRESVSLKKVCDLLGHRSVKTTERYAHLQTDKMHADLAPLMM